MQIGLRLFMREGYMARVGNHRPFLCMRSAAYRRTHRLAFDSERGNAPGETF